ncbi:MAG: TetR/AcrR family transcriptional regulator [Microthrixaceae bacterium]|nr:TetR/AcrR family transcriptional regulator [Microthrixaceae bacterium]
MTGVARRGRPRLTEGQRATQRAEVLAGAMDSIRRRGAEVSLQEIAHDSGVSKPVLYGHFGDRLGLADAIAVVMADDVTDTAMDEVERLSGTGRRDPLRRGGPRDRGFADRRGGAGTRDLRVPHPHHSRR